MCGIAGYLGYQLGEDSNAIIERMTRSLAHRGPSDQGIMRYRMTSKSDQGPIVRFGHRRLKIIDLSQRAHQPMANDDGTIHLTYNGEVYNYLELRDELIRMGMRFRSDSDTEVVVKAYEAWGEEAFARFNGMWGLALLDQRRGLLLLSRDRLGQKPLYYARTETGLIFGSEPKAILAHPDAPHAPNYEKIYRYLAYNYRYVDIDNESFFDGIHQVPKGHVMRMDARGDMTTSAYWSLQIDHIREDMTDEQAIEGYRERFFQAVKYRLRSDVPVGCMLSGGLDSTSITSVAYKVLNTPIITFSGITGDKKGVYDESEYIQAVIEACEAQATFVRPNPADIFETVTRMLGFHDEPICTVTWYGLFLIAEQVAQRNIPVILNGHGGDELLGGYWDHYHYRYYDAAQEGDLLGRDHEIASWQANHRRDPFEVPRSHKMVADYARDEISGMQKFANYERIFSTEAREQHGQDIRVMPLSSPILQQRLASELLYETIPASLRPEDRNTMAHSLESRSPFLDYELVDFCFTLPNRMKIRNGVGKWVLREAMKGILPEAVRTRKDKSGFIAPADVWFRTTNLPQIDAMLAESQLLEQTFFNKSALRTIRDEHVEGRQNHQMFLWQLINLDLWYQRFFQSGIGQETLTTADSGN